MKSMKLFGYGCLSLALSMSGLAHADEIDPFWRAGMDIWNEKGDMAAQGDVRALAELQLIMEFCNNNPDCLALDDEAEPSLAQQRVAFAAVELGRLYEQDILAAEDKFDTAQRYYATADALGSPYGSHRLGTLYLSSSSPAYRSVAPVFLERGIRRGVAASAVALVEYARRTRNEEDMIYYSRLGLGLTPDAEQAAVFQDVLRSRGLAFRGMDATMTREPELDLTPQLSVFEPTELAPASALPERRVAACARVSEELATEWQDLRAHDARLSRENDLYKTRRANSSKSAPFVPPGPAADVVREELKRKNDALQAQYQRLDEAFNELNDWGTDLTQRQEDFNRSCDFPIALKTYNAVCTGPLGGSPYCQSIQF